MTQNLATLIDHYGLAIVFVNVLLSQAGLPLPVVPTLIFAGSLAAGSLAGGATLSLPGLISVAVIACLMADTAWYFVGRSIGMRVLKTLCRISLEPDSCVSQTQNRFERWGVNSLLIAKFVPGLSIVAPPLAGAMGISAVRFVIFSFFGALLFVGAGLGVGVLFKAQIAQVLAHLQRIGALALATFIIFSAIYILFKWWQRHRFYATLRMARISVDDLYGLIESGAQPIIIDVRSNTARGIEPRWIPGAAHVTFEEIGPRTRDLPRDRDIIVYCTCPNEATAARVAKRLMHHGFHHVRPLQGGLEAWIAAGYSVESLP